MEIRSFYKKYYDHRYYWGIAIVNESSHALIFWGRFDKPKTLSTKIIPVDEVHERNRKRVFCQPTYQNAFNVYKIDATTKHFKQTYPELFEKVEEEFFIQILKKK